MAFGLHRYLLGLGISLLPMVFSQTPAARQFNTLYAKEFPVSQNSTQVLLQGFTWNAKVNGKEGEWYSHLESKASQIARFGFTHLWFPPVSRSVSPQGYMPGDYYDLGRDQDKTFYGSEKELRKALKTFADLGVVTLADIVINHRTASHQENGVWNIFHHGSQKMVWEKWALARGDYGGSGNPDTGEDFEPAPDIDHTHPKVRKDISDWLNWLLKDLGFQGFRFDFVKGYSGDLLHYYLNGSQAVFAVGELWSSMDYSSDFVLKPGQDAHRQKIVDWIDSTQGEAWGFDFTSKGILQEALAHSDFWRLKDKEGKASGVLGWWPGRALTFLDNHDTGGEQSHWPFPEEHLLKGYAYILTHPGMPSVFWGHLYNLGTQIRDPIVAMIQLRHEMGIHDQSHLTILVANQSHYVARTDDKILLKLGTGDYRPGTAWKLRLRGEGYEIFTR
jgi:alpha-amylase